MKGHLELLGFKVRDCVTGLSGTVTSISFDLYGCIQALVNPGLDKDGKAKDQYWFDLKRLEKMSDAPVMAVPTFASVPGGEGHPTPGHNLPPLDHAVLEDRR